ncbi:MAG: GAF domain-containing protein [Candidatus Aminicenantes bacterium]|nr:GAF domain-containing protein [Candidatus Aminicenantes bacterium]
MKDINLLLEKFKMSTGEGYTETAFKTVVNDIAKFYCDNFELEADEVAILLVDKDSTVLSFAYPEHLVNAGMIPVSSPDAFAARVFKLNRGMIENNFNQMKHLHLFEYIKGPGDKIRRIWKMMSTVIRAGEQKIGIIELSRKGEELDDTGEDFSQENLEFLEVTIVEIGPYLQRVLPPDFRGKLL